MKEPYLKYLTAVVVTLLAGVGFAFDFLLRAKDYPQLSLVMLAVIALVIAALSFGAAFGMVALLAATLGRARGQALAQADPSQQQPQDPPPESVAPARFSLRWFGGQARNIMAFVAITVCLGVGWYWFVFALENLGHALAVLRDHLLAQMP